MYSAEGNYIEGFSGSCEKKQYIYGVGEAPNEEVLSVTNCPDNSVDSLTVGSSIHKAIRKHIRPFIKPGLKLSELADLIENKCKELTKEQGINQGIGFPSSLSVNDCAAHFTPSKLYDVTLNEDSIVKIDFGVHVNGWITDSAFTVAFNDKYKNLLDGVKEATYTGLKNAAIDVNIKEWGKDIQEVMESYEVELDGKTYPIQVIKNLGGHNILKNRIHGGVFLPGAYISYYPNNLRFQEGVYAVETFGSTASDNVEEKLEENTIYMNKSLTTHKIAKNKKLSSFYSNLLKKYKTMPYCNRYLDKLYNESNYLPKMSNLIYEDLVTGYPPLHCSNGGMTAQYEHTIHLSENKKLIFSQSTDY